MAFPVEPKKEKKKKQKTTQMQKDLHEIVMNANKIMTVSTIFNNITIFLPLQTKCCRNVELCLFFHATADSVRFNHNANDAFLL